MAAGIEVNQEEYRNLQREIAYTEQKLKALEAEQKQLASVSAVQLQQIGKDFAAMGEKVSEVGKTLVALTAAVAAVGVASIATSIKFESSFAGVKKTVDATTEELNALADASREAALTTPIDVNDINYIKELGGQLGIATANLNSFSEVIAALDVATDMNLDDASMQLAQFMNICGTAQTDINRLGSTIVALGNTSATTESTIANFAMRIAGTGTSIGLTEAQILGLSASMASVGIQAEMGGSAISTIMSTIDKDVAKNGENLKVWAETAGMSAQEFAAAWQADAANALIALIGGMEEASSSGENLNLILDELGVSNIRQTDTLKRLTSAAELMSTTMDNANVAWNENSALMKEAGQRYATTESKITMLKNKVSEIAISIGNGLSNAVANSIDVLNPMLDALIAIAHAFENANPTVQSIIIGITGVTASIAPLLIISGKLMTLTGNVVTSLGKAAAAYVAKASATSVDTASTTANTVAQDLAIAKQAIKDAVDAKAILSAKAKAAATTADAVATTANTAATTANASTAGVAAIKTAALSLAVKAKTVATTAATVAQIAWNAAMAANPIGAVLAAIGALVAVLGTLAVAVASNTNKQEKLTEASEKQRAEIEDLQKSYDEIVAAQGEHSDAAIKAKYALDKETAAFEETKETIEEFIARCEEATSSHDELAESIQKANAEAETQAGKVLYLAEQIAELSAVENKSAENKTQLSAMTEMLNESCEELNLTYDAQNDTLNMSVDAINRAAAAEADRLRSQAAMQAYSDLLTEQIQLEIQLAEAQENLAAETQRNIDNWGMLGNTQVYTSKTQLELEQSTKDLEAALAENVSSQQRALDIGTRYSESQSALARAIEEVKNGTLSAEEAAEKYSATTAEVITADQIHAEMAKEAGMSQEQLAEAINETATATQSLASSAPAFQTAMSQSITGTSAQLESRLSTLGIELRGMSQTAAEAGQAAGNSYSESLTGAISQAPQEVQLYIGELEAQLKSAEDGAAASGKATGTAYSTSLASSIASCPTEVQEHIIRLESELAGFQEQAGNIGANAGSAFSDGIQSATGKASSAAATLKSGAESQMASSKAGIYGSNVGNTFAAGIGSTLSNVSANAQSIASCCHQWAAMSNEAKTWGWDAGSQFASGLQSARNLVRNAATSIASAARAILHFSVPDEGPLADADTYGPDFGALIADGLRSKIAEVRTAASDVAHAAKDEITNALSGDLSVGGNMSLAIEQSSSASLNRSFFSGALNAIPSSLLTLASSPAIPSYAFQLADKTPAFSAEAKEQQQANIYNFGDININAADMRDAQSIKDFVKVIQRAKAANPTRKG